MYRIQHIHNGAGGVTDQKMDAQDGGLLVPMQEASQVVPMSCPADLAPSHQGGVPYLPTPRGSQPVPRRSKPFHLRFWRNEKYAGRI